MATLNSLQLVPETVGQQATTAYAKLTAVAADDTAGSFTVDFSSRLKAVHFWTAEVRASDGQLKAAKVTLSVTTFTVADGGTDTIAANDTITIVATGDIA